MKSEIYQGLIEILERISKDKSWNNDDINGYISWLKENMHISEGIEMDKKNEEEFKNREEKIKAYIEKHIDTSEINGKILWGQYKTIIGKRKSIDDERGKQKEGR